MSRKLTHFLSRQFDSDVTLASAAINGETVENPDRLDLLQRLKAGEYLEVDIDAVTFSVGPEIKNRNNVTLSLPAMRQFAKASPNTPFARDHSLTTQDMGGFVLKSKVQKIDGGHGLFERIRLNQPWAVESALNGNMKKFSIHFSSLGIENVFCSLCKAGIQDCQHYPGQTVTQGKKEKTVQFISQQADPVERSWVVRPAVEATGMETSFLSALSEIRADRAPIQKDKIMDFEKLAALLGCDPTEESITSALQAREALAVDSTSQLSDLQTSIKQKDEEITKLNESLKEYEVVKLKSQGDKLVSELAENFGLRKDGAMDKLIRSTLEAGNSELAESLAETVREDWKLKSEPMQQKGEIVVRPVNTTHITDAKELASKLQENDPETYESFRELIEKDAKAFFRSHQSVAGLAQPGINVGDLK